MNIEDVRNFTLDQLEDELIKLKREQFNLRFQKATSQLTNTARFAKSGARLRGLRPSNARSAWLKRKVKEDENAKARFAGCGVWIRMIRPLSSRLSAV